MTTGTGVSQPAVPNRLERVLHVTDRGFPLVWLAIYALLPVSGWAGVMFASWHDQELFLETLRSVLAERRADAIDENLVGPAYIALAAAFHWVGGLSPEDSLVALNRVSYALSVAGGLVLVRVLVHRLVGAPPLVSLTSQFVLVGLVFAAGTWHWSDVPWSHFVAACLAILLYVVRFAPARATTVSTAALGAVLALMLLTRSLEGVALVAAWAIGAAILALLRLSSPRRVASRLLVSGAVAFFATAAAAQLVTGKHGVFFLYGGDLDEGGNILAAESAKTSTFSFVHVPTKLVQLFYEPCYYSLCSLSDYAGGTRPLPEPLAEAAGNERLWRLPLAIQLPALLLLPLCLVVVGGLLIWFVRNRAVASRRVRELRLLLEMTIAATGLVLGYVASTISGAPHLRYGLARDFLLPALLVAVVAVALASAGFWVALARPRRSEGGSGRLALSTETMFVGMAFLVVAAGVAGTVAARATGLPRIESRMLGALKYEASCRDDVCDVEITARTVSGRPIEIPERSTLTFGCGSDRPRFTVYAKEPSAGVDITSTCRDPRLVAAWPTVMGLPPGSYELGFVRVSNAAG